MSRVAILTAVAVILLVSVPAWGQSRYSANGHYYERVGTAATWTAAKTAASNKTYSGMTGYLVCITTSGENAFLVSTFGSFGAFWIGAYQGPNPTEPSGDWQWVSGEKWSYTNWNSREPNNASGREHIAEFYGGNGFWNDNWASNTRAYVVEYEPTATMVIEDDAAATTTADVTLTLDFESGDDAGTPQVRFRNGTGTWSEWTTYSTSVPWTLDSTQGTKTVNMEFKDAHGLVYTASNSIHLDTTAPTGSVAIEGGREWTNSSTVALDLTYDDSHSSVASMRFRIPGEAWNDWIPAAPSAAFTLTAGEGLRSVEAEFRDDAGNVSPTASDDIGIDLIAPTVEVVAADGEDYVGTRHVPLTLDATDTGSGVESMRFRVNGGSWIDWLPFESPTTVDVGRDESSKTIEVQVRDRAGNVSDDTADPVTLDISEPEITHFRINAGAPYVLPDEPLGLELSAMDNPGGSGATDFSVSFDRGSTWSPWRAIFGGWLANVDRPTEDGVLQVRAMVRDVAGNESDADQATIYLVERDLPVASGGGKLTGTLYPAADVDAFAVDLAKGDILSVKVKGKPGSGNEELILAIDLASATDGVLHTGRYPEDAKTVMIKSFVAPATDRYYVLLLLDPESEAQSGACSLSVKVKQNKLGKKGKGVAADGRVAFSATDGSLLKASLKGEGLTAANVTLTGPDGPVTFTAKEGKGSVKLEAVLDSGTGAYEIVVDPAIEVSWKWKLKLPQKVKLAIQG